MKRLRVGVLYGGRSGEHEVSLASAASVFAHLDRTRYEPVPIRIEKDGRWALADKPPASMIAGDVIEQARIEAARPVREGREVHFVARPSEETILSIDRSRSRDADVPAAVVTGLSLDVIFPMLHGPYGEDGTIQGLLELANIPYVGAGVLASAVGMDKAIMKVAVRRARPPRLPLPRRPAPRLGAAPRADRRRSLEKALRFPMFVKPANLGSSVGISKAKDAAGLREAMALAGSFDRKIVDRGGRARTRARSNARVLGNDEPEASVPGEIIPSREFYDYEAKYLDDGSKAIIPADLPKKTASDEVRRLSIEAFKAIDGAGMARVDFLLARGDGQALRQRGEHHSRVSRRSACTPKLWAASGVDVPGAARSADRARDRAPRREAAAPHQRDMTARGLCCVTGDRAAGRCAVLAAAHAPDHNSDRR